MRTQLYARSVCGSPFAPYNEWGPGIRSVVKNGAGKYYFIIVPFALPLILESMNFE